MNKRTVLFLAAAVSLHVSAQQVSELPVEPSVFTKAFNDSVTRIADSFGSQDFDDARRGFIATFSEADNPQVDGRKLYDLKTWSFLDGKAPSTVNPLLWRQAQLNSINGLFEVVKGKIWQVRGFDIANITFVKSKNGYIVIDASTNNATSAAALALFRKHIGKAPIQAVIITHSHGDHFGGVKGIVDNADNGGKPVPVIAPKDYFKNSANENVLAGIPMRRHSVFMFGLALPVGEDGYVTSGLGSSLKLTARVTSSLLPATQEISKDVEAVTVDGLKLELILAQESEAPSEMLVYIPEYHALQQAEDINHTLHNLLTPRGAKIRNGLAWSKYIDKVISRYGSDVEVSLGSHHWPVWGNGNVVNLWEKQRDLYRYIHDHTVYLANKGYTPNDISNLIKLPASQSSFSANREYYGTVSFNARSQYELYFGFFDGNPANLDPLSPAEEARKTVEAIGGAEKAISIAKEAYDKGDYRWAATLLNKVVFAEPANKEARLALANAYAQLAYRAESAPWRNFYLQGAQELKAGHVVNKLGPDALRDYTTLTPGLFFDVVATRINGYAADGNPVNINVNITDNNSKVALIFKNGALTNRPGEQTANADATVSGSKAELYALFSRQKSLADSKNIKTTGNSSKLQQFLDAIETPRTDFNVVEPN